MNVNISEREQRKLLKKDLCSIFDNQITSENIQQYIFGKSGYDEDAISNTNQYVQYFKNVMSLAFYFAYTCYRSDADSDESDAENISKHNSKRIINSLKNAFIKYPVTPDLIQFVLTDIQFELAQGNDSELKDMFANMCSNNMSDFSFNPYLKIIAEYDKNPSRFQGSRIELMELFIELLSVMTFLGGYSLECYGDDSFYFVKTKASRSKDDKYSKMSVEHLFYRNDERYFGGIYRLFSLERGEKNIGPDSKEKCATLRLKYLTPGEERSLSFIIPGDDDGDAPDHLIDRNPEEVFSEITGQEGYSDGDQVKKNSNKIDLVHTVNYKYTKNLALAVSDAISSNSGSKKLIYNRFNRQYPYIFERNSVSSKGFDSNDAGKAVMPYDDELLDWDTIVIMLIIEVSPTVVLECIIRKFPEAFYDIGYNLYKRFYDHESLLIFSKKKKKIIDREVNMIIKEKLIVGEAEGFGKIPSEKTYEKLFPRAAAMLLVSILSKLQDNEREDNLIYTGNLHSNITLLERVRSDTESEKKIRYSSIILGETLKHLMCFYTGIFEYGKSKAVYDIATYDKFSSRSEINERQRDLESKFLSAAKDQAGKLSKYTLESGKSTSELMKMSLELFELFVGFCEDCTLSNNTLSDRSKNLYAAVGKYEITNTRVIKRQLKQLSSAAGNFMSCDADKWIKICLDTLELFKTGSFSDTPIDHDLFNAIYPFTAVFNRGKENPDGYKTVNFSLNIDLDEDTVSDYHIDVNVLSEFSYSRSEVYYCLPNVLRSNIKWWIDPLLINFREFNDIFLSGRDDN